MNESFKIPLIIIGIVGVVFSINSMLSSGYTGAGLLLLTSALCFGILYRGK